MNGLTSIYIDEVYCSKKTYSLHRTSSLRLPVEFIYNVYIIHQHHTGLFVYATFVKKEPLVLVSHLYCVRLIRFSEKKLL